MLKFPSSNIRLRSKIESLGLDFKDGTKLASPYCGAAHFELQVASGENLALNVLDPTLFCFWDCVSESPKRLCNAIERFTPSEESFRRYKRHLSDVRTPPATLEDSNKVAFHNLVVRQCSNGGLGEDFSHNWDSDKLIKNINRVHKKLKDAKIFHMDPNNFLQQDFLKDFLVFLDHPNNDDFLNELLKHKKFIMIHNSEVVQGKYSWANVNEIGAETVIYGNNED